MFNYEILMALFITIGLVLFFIYVKPLSFGYYKEIRLALLIVQTSFRDDKVKQIADIVMSIVNDLEKLDVDNSEKQAYAIQLAGQSILEKLGITLDEDILALIVDVAVAYIPKTHQE
jgi:hypothetical protein